MTKIDERMVKKKFEEIKAQEERFIALAVEIKKINEEFNVELFADSDCLNFHLKEFDGVVVGFDNVLSGYQYLKNKEWEIRVIKRKGE